MSTTGAANASTRAAAGRGSHINGATGIGAVKQEDDYEILVSLLPRGGAPKPLPDDHRGGSSDQIVFDTTVERIYQPRGTTSAKPASVGIGSNPDPDPTRITSGPRYTSASSSSGQIVVESHRSRFRIPIADEEDSSFGIESVSSMVSRMNIPFHFEKNVYWRRLSRPLPWIAVESTAELTSLIVDTVRAEISRVGSNGDGGGRKVEVKMVLNIAKKSRVGEAEYQGICRAIEDGQIIADLEKFLMHIQDRHAASATTSGGGLERLSVDELKLMAEEHVTRIDSGTLMTILDSDTIDSVARRASKEWERSLVSKLSNALVMVDLGEEREERDESNPVKKKPRLEKRQHGECSICLAPKLPSTDPVAGLPNCIHTFHRDCLLQWLLHTPNCPLCRSSPLPSLYHR